MPSNTAAWQSSPGVPLEIKSAPYTSPASDEIIIKGHAIAINPIDFKLQDKALFPFLKYPVILGSDVAGEVIEVGSSVTHFKPGDRVIGQGMGTTGAGAHYGAFQQYTVVLARLASKIPNNMSYTDASVLPLSLSTASCGLYQQDYLNLQHPSLNPKPTGQTLLVWGGASSVGTSSIQLAIASGYEVFATASPKNFDLLKKLGASQVFDYTQDSKEVLEQLVQAFDGKHIAGVTFVAGTPDVADLCAALLSRTSGNKFLSSPVVIPEKMPEGVSGKRVFGATLKDNEVCKILYQDFLPQALEQGKILPLPEAEVVGKGLESLQKGLDMLRKGVSAKKLVVTLD